MTFEQFTAKNADILLAEVPADKLLETGNGTVYFYVATPPGTKDKNLRKVVRAGYVTAVHTYSPDGIPEAVEFLSLTKSGYAKIDTIQPSELSHTGAKTLFYTKPLNVKDPRHNKRWDEWP